MLKTFESPVRGGVIEFENGPLGLERRNSAFRQMEKFCDGAFKIVKTENDPGKRFHKPDQYGQSIPVGEDFTSLTFECK
jgi:hypothetical protein